MGTEPAGGDAAPSLARPTRPLTALARLGFAYAAVVAAILAVGLATESGFLAIVNIFSEHLALVCLALVPVAILARSRALGLALLAVLGLFLLRFGSDWISVPAAGGEPGAQLRVATWNLEAGSRPAGSAVAMLRAHPVDVVALEELTPDVAAAIEADPALTARYPHRALDPDRGVLGIGLLSRYPIGDATYAQSPARIEARLALPDGELVVLAAHPLPARLRERGGIPVGYEPRLRNAELGQLRARVEEHRTTGSRVLLIGDFNVAPAEPAFARLTNGLYDAHAEVGFGPGWTWRPEALEPLGTGLLRIDLILTTSEVVPTSDSIACPPVGDHCFVEAGLRLAQRGYPAAAP